MSMTLPLPPSLQDRLTGLGGRVRRLRCLRGVGRLLLILVPLAAAALAADFFLGLPSLARLGLLASWLAVGAWGLMRWVVGPLVRRLDEADLAAAVEEQYPELGERLLSSVELARDERPSSPALARLLMDETEARSSRLDFAAAAPGRTTRLMLSFGAFAVLALITPSFFFPLASARLAGRFLFPFASPAVDPDYTFAVDPGDVSAAKGRPLPIRVTLRPRDEFVTVPPVMAFIVRDDQGERRFVPFPVDMQTARYEVGYTPRGDTEYTFTAGNATSERYTITAIDPVELLPDSPTITITPPEYARATRDGETAHGLTDLSALRGSEIRFAFAFNRPAVVANLRFGASTIPLTPAPDHRTMTATITVNEEATYRLLLEAENGVKTPAGDEPFGGKVTVKPDEPPVVLAMKGVMDGRKIRAHDRLMLDGKFADDVAVASATLEYRVNGETEVRAEKLKLAGAGRREAELRQSFALAGKVKPGDVLNYRLRYEDNRPAAFGGPNVKYLPEGKWYTLDVVAQGKSPREEEIAERHDEIEKKLEAIAEELRQEARAADKVRAESRAEEELSGVQRDRLSKVQEQNRRVQKMLEEAAREAEKDGELQPLADQMRELAAQEMADAGKEFDRAAAPKAEPARREQAFRGAEKELSAALDKIDKLKKENDRLAKDRTDQAKVEALADRQKALAEEAAEKEADQLKREQQKVEEELAQLERDSDLLKKALEEARAEQARKEAEKAAELAKQQRELAAAIDDAEKARNKERLAELADKQAKLAAKAERLAKETEKALGADRSAAMKAEDAKKAADALKTGEAEKALAEQDKTARDLDQLARDLRRLADGAKDAREAARQLAIMEEMLGKKTRAEKELTPEKAAALAKEQQAIREAVKDLQTPARADIAAQKRRTDAALAEAEKALASGKKAEAEAKLDAAKDALRKLAGMMPTLGERKEQARADVEKLAREQEDIARKTELAKHEGKSTEALASRQDNLARRLDKLDAPGLEERRDRAREQMAQAVKDLEGKNPEDAKVAQDRAKRELNRIKDALEGRKPVDEKAAALAERQKELAAQAEKAAADPKTSKARQEDLRGKQNALAWEAEVLAAPDTPAAKKEALKAVRDAAKKANDKGATSPEARKAMEESAKKLDDLARALAGDEKDAEKAERLAKQQDRATKDAKDRPGTFEDTQRARDLAKEVAGTRGGDAKAEKQKAKDALDRAAKATPEQRAKADADATEALKNLAKKLAAGGEKAPAKAEKTEAKGSPLANKGQAEAAKELAKEQRELRDAVKREMSKREAAGEDKASGAAKEQAEIAKEAAELAKDVAGEQGEKSGAAKKADAAGKATGEAAKDLAAGSLEKGATAGKDAESALKELAKSLQDTKRGDGKGDTFEQARKLAARQEKLNQELGPLAKDADAARGRQEARQGELEKMTGELAKRLGDLGKKADDAADAARGAKEAMRQAGELGKQGWNEPAKAARERAAKGLERAAEQAAKAGEAKGDGKSGKALGDAKGQMGEAREQLGKGRQDGAAKSMASAAQQLREAAEALARSMQPPGMQAREGQPGGPGGKAEGGEPDGKTDVRQALGFDPKKWGELPGEMKTKITQDLRAKFGDDYARMIKLYFEQLADTRKK